MELIQRPRRLRSSDSLRRMVRETRVSPDSLIYPIFVDELLKGKRPITLCLDSISTVWTVSAMP